MGCPRIPDHRLELAHPAGDNPRWDLPCSLIDPPCHWHKWCTKMTRGGELQLTMPCFHWQIWWILDSGRFRRHYHIIMFGNYFEPWKCAFLHVNLHPVFPEQNIVFLLRLLNLYQILSHFTSFQPGNFQGIVSPLTINSTVMSHLAPSASKHRILRVLLYVKHDMAL